MRLVDADKLEANMYHEAFETDTDMQKWDSGCWIRYKMFENVIEKLPTVEAIPIEWLHSIMEKQLIFAMNSEMEGTTTVQDGVIHCISGALACQVLVNVIELWEKENER